MYAGGYFAGGGVGPALAATLAMILSTTKSAPGCIAGNRNTSNATTMNNISAAVQVVLWYITWLSGGHKSSFEHILKRVISSKCF